MEGSFLVRKRPAASLDRLGSHRRCSTPRNLRKDSPRTATPGFAFTDHKLRPSCRTEWDSGRFFLEPAMKSPQRRGG